MNEHIGSSLNDFLEEEGLLEESEKAARERIVKEYKKLGLPVNNRIFRYRVALKDIEPYL